MNESAQIKYIARNRKARHDYEIKQTLEAGISLLGSEVKSLREGKINISDAYATLESGEVVLKNLHIQHYKMANENHDPYRNRRLLLHKSEIRKIKEAIEQKGLTLIPLSIYLRRNLVKIELGIALGRKKYDKRQAIAKADADRKMKRATNRNY